MIFCSFDVSTPTRPSSHTSTEKTLLRAVYISVLTFRLVVYFHSFHSLSLALLYNSIYFLPPPSPRLYTQSRFCFFSFPVLFVGNQQELDPFES